MRARSITASVEPVRRLKLWTGSLCAVAVMTACGGGGSVTSTADTTVTAGTTVAALSIREASRLADQASFGATEALVSEIQAKGAVGWVAAQMALNSSRYVSGGTGSVHRLSGATTFCDLPPNQGANCWRDNYSITPLVWDFYRNAVGEPDQLRQRVAFALQQTIVVSAIQCEGTYGFRKFHNDLLDNAFTNYRQVLKKAIVSPVMGDYLNNVNNDKSAPNENLAREMLQLFALGTCELNSDGTLKGGKCNATYNNDTVRAYAYALTGWTFPAGGSDPGGCWPSGANCRYYAGDMVPFAQLHDSDERKLLSGISLPAGHSAPIALERVLDSVMAHPNIAPFVAQRLIEHLVSSNPSPAYIARVAAAFRDGAYVSGGTRFGTGVNGDMAASVAAVLLDSEARRVGISRSAGKLREPALLFSGVLRALNGKTDGDALQSWGDTLRQPLFLSPSVFNFYPPGYPVPGSALSGSAFALHNADAALQRLNYLAYLIDLGGAAADISVPNATGTKIDLSAFAADAADVGALVDRLSVVAFGQSLPASARDEVIKAVSMSAASDNDTRNINRAKAAAYLVFASPNYQVQR